MSGAAELRAALTEGSPTPTAAADRIRFDAADANDEVPYVVIHRVLVDREYGLDNTLLGMKETFQVECWADTPAQAQDLEAEVVAALAAADLVPSPNEPDGLDPRVDVHCVVLSVDIWTTPQIA